MIIEVLEAGGGLLLAGLIAHRLGLIGPTEEQRAFRSARYCQSMRNTAKHEVEASGRVESDSVVDHLRGCDRPLCRDARDLYSRAAVDNARVATQSLAIMRQHLDDLDVSEDARADVTQQWERYRAQAVLDVDYAARWFFDG